MLITPSEANNETSIRELIKNATVDNYSTVLERIQGLDCDIEKEIYISDLARVLKINKTSLMKQVVNEPSADVIKKAVFPELVDLVLDDKGNATYLVRVGDKVECVATWDTADGETYVPPERGKLPFELANADKVLGHYRSGVDAGHLYEDLVTYCKRFSYLPDETWPLVIFSVFLSYLQDHKEVGYIPTIYFHAVAERGKSRTAKSLLSVSYRGIHLVDLRSANIFRYAENLNATLFFDCTDLWHSAEKSDCSDILLGRFEKGTMVSRVQYPDRGAFDDQVQYKIFGSTVVATNEPANVTFESRCLTITMPNKPGEYENITPDMGVELKERLTAWRATMMGVNLPNVARPEGVNGRLWDITKPLFQLCSTIKPALREAMTKVLLEMVGQKTEDKKESLEGQLISAIMNLVDFDEYGNDVIPVEDIRQNLNIGKSERYHITSQKLGKRIKSLSLETKSIKGYSHLTISSQELRVLCEQYGLVFPEPETDNSVTISTSHDDVQSGEVESGRELLDAGPVKKPRPWNSNNHEPQTQTKPVIRWAKNK